MEAPDTTFEDDIKAVGQSTLALSKTFYDQVLFIKKHLNVETHPIRAIIEYFKQVFVKNCMVLLCKESDPKAKEILAEATFEEKMNYVKMSLLRVINVLVDSVLMFYALNATIRPIDLKRELFWNLITNFILEGELYFLMFNLVSNCYNKDLQKLNKIMNSMEILENTLPMKKLNIAPQF